MVTPQVGWDYLVWNTWWDVAVGVVVTHLVGCIFGDRTPGGFWMLWQNTCWDGFAWYGLWKTWWDVVLGEGHLVGCGFGGEHMEVCGFC